ncbi:MAG: L-aspartate oxidase [Nitrospirae bacterium]|nr:L-aspartate oxidase [Nitrospirota bacterium]
MQNEIIDTDFLVIGAGIAGLRAAIELSSYGNVIIVTKDTPAESSSEYAQGGVAVALSDEDEVGIHFEDTLKAGDGLCREDAVRTLVEEGAARIMELIKWGAEFDREGAKLAFSMEAAHSKRRVLHAHGDSTGKELMRTLINKARTLPSLNRLQFSTAIDLIVDERVCKGAYILSESSVVRVNARATLLCTGGAGQIYSRTTNPAVATGDGIAMAFRGGAVLEDMEFVQFHPTALFAASAPQFLLSEAMRGEGAVLRNINKEEFMKQYHDDAELAPRDVVSRAIISEMVKTNAPHVYLDITHIDTAFVSARFPMIFKTCLQYGVNITKDLIPVSPAAHYSMGGVKTDLNGATTIHGLYAAGEAACTGVHGANRLASNSLLEGLVFGCRAGKAAGERVMGLESSRENEKSFVGGECLSSGAAASFEIEETRTALRRLMWERVGIIRCGISLNEAKTMLLDWRHIIDLDFRTRVGIELKNMLTAAMIITEAAIKREGSIGAHYRSDFKERDENWQRHISLIREDKGIRIFDSL